MKIAIGCDELAYDMKKEIIRRFSLEGVEFIDYGVGQNEKADYPDIAQLVTAGLKNHEADRAILICGTGIGMCISANKVSGIYAAVCHDLYSTKRSVLSNDINVMCIGALVIGIATATEMVRTWLSLEFKESPSLRKINKIKEIEALQLTGADHEK
ncbi:MAG: RpiB/LacA/LacB family sugar-phosphate isomerase [Erysipelotrichaceae bacterium]